MLEEKREGRTVSKSGVRAKEFPRRPHRPSVVEGEMILLRSQFVVAAASDLAYL